MRKTSTILTKCSSGIVAALAMLTYAFPASAEEYKSMIRYDRVWENISGPGEEIRCVRFDGPEEINGKTYHRLVTFKKSRFKYGDIQAFVTEDCYEIEGYMREENGVVYALVYEYINESGDSELGGTHFPESDEPVAYREHVLYDMNLDEGDSYTAFEDIYDYNACLGTLKVLNTSYIDIAGERCKMMYVCSSWYDSTDTDYTWFPCIVEGIGTVSRGCLNCYNFGDIISGMLYRKYFLRYFDMEGNLLYYTPGYDPEGDAPTYGSFISEVEPLMGAEETDAPIYDILGRRIANPAPGQLYIQGGKKHIAR